MQFVLLCVFLYASLSTAIISQLSRMNILLYFQTVIIFHAFSAPFSSSRQCLSYDGCLKVRGEIIRSELYCVVLFTEAEHSHKHT